MARTKRKTRPMLGKREWIENTDPATLKTDGRWKLRASLWLFGADNVIFESNEWYHKQSDCYANYRLIFFGDWAEVDETGTEIGEEE